VAILIFQDVQENRRTHTGKCIDCKIVSLAGTEFEDRSGVNKCANTDNMSEVHCKLKRLGARLTYGVRTLGVQACVSALVCGILSLFLGIWWRADFVIFALFSGVYLNLLNY